MSAIVNISNHKEISNERSLNDPNYWFNQSLELLRKNSELEQKIINLDFECDRLKSQVYVQKVMNDFWI